MKILLGKEVSGWRSERGLISNGDRKVLQRKGQGGPHGMRGLLYFRYLKREKKVPHHGISRNRIAVNKWDVRRLVCVMVITVPTVGVPMGVMMRTFRVAQQLTGGKKGNLVASHDC